LADCHLTYEKIAEMTKCHHSTVIASVTKVRNEYIWMLPNLYAFYKVLRDLVAPYKFALEIDKPEAKRVYICGKITGLNESDVELKFKKATEYLQTKHEIVVNPYEYCKEIGITGWYECMRVLVPVIATMEIIYVLNDYYDSNGGIWEIAIADKVYNIPIVKLNM
jgi:hypothetical protein